MYTSICVISRYPPNPVPNPNSLTLTPPPHAMYIDIYTHIYICIYIAMVPISSRGWGLSAAAITSNLAHWSSCLFTSQYHQWPRRLPLLMSRGRQALGRVVYRISILACWFDIKQLLCLFFFLALRNELVVGSPRV